MGKNAQGQKQKTPKVPEVSVPTPKKIVRSFQRIVGPVKKKP